MSNVHLPFVSVYQRMTDFVHTLAYAGVIRNSVTWVLYATEREELILALSGLTIFTLDNVLCGSNECSEGENYAIIDAVQLFIKQTKRFIQT